MWIVLSRALGALAIFAALVLLMTGLGLTSVQLGEQASPAALAIVTALGLGVLGALPFVPMVARKRWALPELIGLALCWAGWQMLAFAVTGELGLLACAVAGGLALTGALLVRSGFQRRPPAEPSAAAENDDDESEPSSSGDLDFDAKISRLKPTRAVTRACICAALGGAFTALGGLQLTGLVFRIALLNAVPYALMLLGAALLLASSRAFKMHELAARAALGLCVLLSLADGAWFVTALQSGLITMFGMITPPLCLTASVLLWKAMPDFKAAASVRRDLEDAGMDLGF